MNSELSLYEVKLKEEVDFFWEKRNQYVKEDIIPNCTLGNPLSEDVKKWLSSKEYKDHIMNLFNRKQDQLKILFFRKNNRYVGFCIYVTYISEDGKCLIVDYCIDSNYRNQGLGKQFFYLLKEHVSEERAKYFALNLSNENNQRFWKSLGFEKAYVDEYGEDVYINRLNMDNIHFRDIDNTNKCEVRKIKLKPEQEKFIETIDECLEEADTYDEWHPVAIYYNEEIIGFAMYGSFGPNKHTWIDRIIIDERHQGKGFGKIAMRKLIDIVLKEYGVNTIYLSIVEENAVAYNLYESIGFKYMNEKDPNNGELLFQYTV